MSHSHVNNVIEEIANWSIEANEENNIRYFYHFNDVALIERGQKNFVIGRKGTGMTAIAKYINRLNSEAVFSKMLTFKNFPFNVLYDLSDDNFTAPNQYITIWEYVICNCVCSMMAQNEAVYSKLDVNLRSVFDVKIEDALSKSIKKITSPGYAVNVLGVGASKSSGVLADVNISWREKVDAIEDFISKNIDESTYYVIFDALDEDYRGIFELADSLIFKSQRNQYLSAMPRHGFL